MRLNEFADAEAQLALLRTIIGNTWKAIEQQAEQQRINAAQRRPVPSKKSITQVKPKARPNKSSKGTSMRIPTPKPPPPMKSQVPLAKQLPSPLNKPNPNALNAFKPLPPTNPQLKQTSTNTAINPKLASAPYPKQIANPPIKPTISSNLAYFDKNLKRIER